MAEDKKAATEKQVTVAIKMDSHFVRLLMANVQLSHLADKDELTPAEQLALTIMLEARGAAPEQVHSSILQQWRPHLEVVEELRKVDIIG